MGFPIRGPGSPSWLCGFAPPATCQFSSFDTNVLVCTIRRLRWSRVFKLGVMGQGHLSAFVYLANSHRVLALHWALGRISEILQKSMINYHYGSYFERETQEGTREEGHEGGVGGCVGLPGGPAVPGIENH